MSIRQAYSDVFRHYSVDGLDDGFADFVSLILCMLTKGVILDTKGCYEHSYVPSLICEITAPDAPMREDALKAMGYIVELTREFPVSQEKDKPFPVIWVTIGLDSIVPRSGISSSELRDLVDFSTSLPYPDFDAIRLEYIKLSVSIMGMKRSILESLYRSVSHCPEILERKGIMEISLYGFTPSIIKNLMRLRQRNQGT